MLSRTNPRRRRPPLRYFALLLVALLSLGAQPAASTECRGWANGGEKVGSLERGAIVEASGLAASRRHDDIFWTHNDSGDGPEIYAIGADGADIGVARLADADADDWEDIAAGPCSPERERSCLYIGDIGDNDEKRSKVTIYKVPEPDIPQDRPATIDVDNWERIDFKYEKGARNAEALLVHPTTAELYVIEKIGKATSEVYRIPTETTPDKKAHTVKKIGDLATSDGLGRMVTGGDISPDGRELSVRTYVKIYTYCLPKGADFEAIFDQKPVVSHPRFTIQSEAIAYDTAGKGLWFTSEGSHPPLIRLSRAK